MKSLTSFLRNPSNSLFRESMFRHDLLHRIYHECAIAQRNVHIYQPEIDVSGFDIVLDDLSNTLRFQLKSKLADAKTRRWNIHKTLLRPNLACLNSLPFSPDSGGAGYMGGVILICADLQGDEIKYSYLYTDALVICAMHEGIHGPSWAAGKKVIEDTFEELTQRDFQAGMMELPQTAFWRFASLKCLLEFAGLNVDSSNPVRQQVHRCVSSLCGLQPMHSETRLDAATCVSVASDLLRPFLHNGPDQKINSEV